MVIQGIQAQQVAKNTTPPKSLGSAGDILPGEMQLKTQAYVVNVLRMRHYRRVALNDSVSSLVLDRYLQALDPSRMYFLESDIKNFEKYRYQLDEALTESNLVPAYYIYNIFKHRFLERNDKISSLLEKEFDYSTDEYFESEREKVAYAHNEDELNDVWRKFLKNQALSLKLSNKNWTESRKILKERYDRQAKNILQFNAEDVFQTYMNAYAGTFDPHTDYFSPQAAADFKQDVTASLEGIGAQLTSENDYVKVVEVINGGPAFKSKLLHKGDRIVGVAQGDTGKFVDIIGWRVIDAVQLIKGKKGTVVRLQILSAEAGENAISSEIRLVREKIKLEDQKAKKEILNVQQNGKNYKFGVITIPGFYLDYEAARRGDKDFNSTSRDVRRFIQEFSAENIDGLVIDLRFNGGGSLQEAVDLSGLFIQQGPVVQVRDPGNIEVLEDQDPQEVYTGPLAVIINRFSASASEIFAGAIQDYKRGIVIGETSYGKGTVQNLFDLGTLMPDAKQPVGQLKITIAKFYRITGSSTQFKGVTPDIELPSAYEASEFGEVSQPSAMPWDQIPPSRYTSTKRVSAELLNDLRKNYQQRLKTDSELKNLVGEIEESKELRKNTKISLNETKRKAEQQALEEREKARRALNGISNDPNVKPKDVYLNEAGRILADAIAKEGGSKTKEEKKKKK